MTYEITNTLNGDWATTCDAAAALSCADQLVRDFLATRAIPQSRVRSAMVIHEDGVYHGILTMKAQRGETI